MVQMSFTQKSEADGRDPIWIDFSITSMKDGRHATQDSVAQDITKKKDNLQGKKTQFSAL